jgi:hypothetical protein
MADKNFSGLGLGLLKFCLQHSDGNVGSTDMSQYQRDPEEYKWLMEALNNLESDTQKMKKLIDKLNDGNLSTQEKKYALEGIQYFVEDLDLANDLIKVNGLTTIVKLLNHEDQEIRFWTAWIIASLSQNNPNTQLALVHLDVLNLLCNIIQTETNENTKDKQLYALSSLTSNNQTLMDLFVDSHNGLPYLTSLILANSPSAQFKVIWFIYKLLSLRPSNLNIVKKDSRLLSNLIKVLSTSERLDTRERAILLLQLIIKDDPAAKQTSISLGLDKTIAERLSKARDEEKTFLENLRKLLE